MARVTETEVKAIMTSQTEALPSDISAFITAISQFRSEFEIEARHEEYSITPVSDIISTVETVNLICAFITVSKPSDLLDLAVKNGIIKQNGDWYSYNNKKIGQGRESIKQKLQNSDDLFDKIRTEVLTKVK